MFPILLFAAFGLLIRSSIAHNKKSKLVKSEDSLQIAESSSVQGVIHESAGNIANVVKRVTRYIQMPLMVWQNKIYLYLKRIKNK